VRYLEAGDTPKMPASLAGLTATILGPPRSEEFLRQMDPPPDEHYLRLAGDEAGGKAVAPFADTWKVGAERYAALLGGAEGARAFERMLHKALPATLDAAVASLDNAVNNQSLVVLFSFGGVNMLFPGDAQWGNWESWLYGGVAGSDGHSDLTEESKRLLGAVNFYKVAHHGSVNATPVAAVEAMPEGHFVAMCSTQSKPWPSIPRAGLMDALEKQTANRVVRSDQLDIDGADAPPAPPLDALPDGFTKGSIYFDYTF
jgi:hypothetical protein